MMGLVLTVTAVLFVFGLVAAGRAREYALRLERRAKECQFWEARSREVEGELALLQHERLSFARERLAVPYFPKHRRPWPTSEMRLGFPPDSPADNRVKLAELNLYCAIWHHASDCDCVETFHLFEQEIADDVR